MRIGRTTYRMGKPKKWTEEEKKAKHQQYNADYDKANTTRLAVKLNNTTDKDILEWLRLMPNKQGYIKDLIRTDMTRRTEIDRETEDVINAIASSDVEV